MDKFDRERAEQEIEDEAEAAASEIERLRIALDRIQDVLKPDDNADHVETVGRAREIALAALNQ